MKKIILFSTVLAMICLISIKGNSQVSGIYEEYGPFKNVTASTYTQIFDREGVKVYVRVTRPADVNKSAEIYFKIENKNSNPAFVDANFKAIGMQSGSYLADSTSGTVPGDRVNPHSFIEVKRYAEHLRNVISLTITLHAIYLSAKSSSGNAN